jgi:hypothetical protein
MLVETFELVRDFDEYNEAVRAFCQRIEQDGLSGVRLMQHYFSRQRNEAFVILIFSNSNVFENHLSFISKLDEMSPFTNTVKLKEIKAFGSMNKEQVSMLNNAKFQFDLVDEHIVGFVRH